MLPNEDFHSHSISTPSSNNTSSFKSTMEEFKFTGIAAKLAPLRVNCSSSFSLSSDEEDTDDDDYDEEEDEDDDENCDNLETSQIERKEEKEEEAEPSCSERIEEEEEEASTRIGTIELNREQLSNNTKNHQFRVDTVNERVRSMEGTSLSSQSPNEKYGNFGTETVMHQTSSQPPMDAKLNGAGVNYIDGYGTSMDTNIYANYHSYEPAQNESPERLNNQPQKIHQNQPAYPQQQQQQQYVPTYPVKTISNYNYNQTVRTVVMSSVPKSSPVQRKTGSSKSSTNKKEQIDPQKVEIEVARNVSQILSATKQHKEVQQQRSLPSTPQTAPTTPRQVLTCTGCNKSVNNAKNLQRHRQSCPVLSQFGNSKLNNANSFAMSSASNGTNATNNGNQANNDNSGSMLSGSYSSPLQNEHSFTQSFSIHDYDDFKMPNDLGYNDWSQAASDQPSRQPSTDDGFNETLSLGDSMQMDPNGQGREEVTTLDPNGPSHMDLDDITITPLSLDVDEAIGHSSSTSIASSQGTPMGFTCQSCRKTVSSNRSLKRHHTTCKQYIAEFGPPPEESKSETKRKAEKSGEEPTPSTSAESGESAKNDNQRRMSAPKGAKPPEYQNYYAPSYNSYHQFQRPQQYQPVADPYNLRPMLPPPPPIQCYSSPSVGPSSSSSASIGLPSMSASPWLAPMGTNQVYSPKIDEQQQQQQKQFAPPSCSSSSNENSMDGSVKSIDSTESSSKTATKTTSLNICDACSKVLCSASNLKRHRATCKALNHKKNEMNSQPSTPHAPLAPSSMSLPPPQPPPQHSSGSLISKATVTYTKINGVGALPQTTTQKPANYVITVGEHLRAQHVQQQKLGQSKIDQKMKASSVADMKTNGSAQISTHPLSADYNNYMSTNTFSDLGSDEDFDDFDLESFEDDNNPPSDMMLSSRVEAEKKAEKPATTTSPSQMTMKQTQCYVVSKLPPIQLNSGNDGYANAQQPQQTTIISNSISQHKITYSSLNGPHQPPQVITYKPKETAKNDKSKEQQLAQPKTTPSTTAESKTASPLQSIITTQPLTSIKPSEAPNNHQFKPASIEVTPIANNTSLVSNNHNTTMMTPMSSAQSAPLQTTKAMIVTTQAKPKRQQEFQCPECLKMYSCRKNVKRHRMAVHKLTAEQIQQNPAPCMANSVTTSNANNGASHIIVNQTTTTTTTPLTVRRHTLPATQDPPVQNGHPGPTSFPMDPPTSLKRKQSAPLMSPQMNKMNSQQTYQVQNLPPQSSMQPPMQQQQHHPMPQHKIMVINQPQHAQQKQQLPPLQQPMHQPMQQQQMHSSMPQAMQQPMQQQMQQPLQHYPSPQHMPMQYNGISSPHVRSESSMTGPPFTPTWADNTPPLANGWRRNRSGEYVDAEESAETARIAAELKRSAEEEMAEIEGGKRPRTELAEADTTFAEDGEKTSLTALQPLSTSSSLGVPSLSSPGIDQMLPQHPQYTANMYHTGSSSMASSLPSINSWNGGGFEMMPPIQQQQPPLPPIVHQQPQMAQQMPPQQIYHHQNSMADHLTPMNHDNIYPAEPPKPEKKKRASTKTHHCTGCQKVLSSDYSLRRHRTTCAEVQRMKAAQQFNKKDAKRKKADGAMISTEPLPPSLPDAEGEKTLEHADPPSVKAKSPEVQQKQEEPAHVEMKKTSMEDVPDSTTSQRHDRSTSPGLKTDFSEKKEIMTNDSQNYNNHSSNEWSMDGSEHQSEQQQHQTKSINDNFGSIHGGNGGESIPFLFNGQGNRHMLPKSLLSEASPYFAQCFKSYDPTKGEMRLVDVEWSDFVVVLDVLQHQSTINDENIEIVSNMAKRFQFNDLYQSASRYISEILPHNSITYALLLADQHQMVGTKKKLFESMTINVFRSLSTDHHYRLMSGNLKAELLDKWGTFL